VLDEQYEAGWEVDDSQADEKKQQRRRLARSASAPRDDIAKRDADHEQDGSGRPDFGLAGGVTLNLVLGIRSGRDEEHRENAQPPDVCREDLYYP